MANNKKTRFICQICNKFLRAPSILVCKCNICYEHLDELFSKENKGLFQCRNCKTINTKSDLKKNKDLELELEKNLHLNKHLRKIKVKLDAKLEEIQLNNTDFLIKINDHFYSIKNDIDIKRETLLQSLYKDKDSDTKVIQRLSANLIEETDSAEEMFRKNFQNKWNLFIFDAQKQKDDAFRSPSLTKNQAKDMNKKFDTFNFSNFEIRLKNNKFIESKLGDGVKKFRLGDLFFDDLDKT